LRNGRHGDFLCFPPENEDSIMGEVPRVILLMYPHCGYDRSVLQGIGRYARAHGPWIFHLAGEEPGLPLPEMETISNAPIKEICTNDEQRRMYVPDLRQWGTTGIIGRLQTPEITKMALKSGVPVIAMDLSDEQLSGGLPSSKVSELRPDSLKAGRMAAEHLLERGFRNFGYCGYANRIWSDRRQEGFCRRLEEAGFSCDIYKPPKRGIPLSWQKERNAIVDWLSSLQKPVGILACNDVRGRQVLEVSTLGKMVVPDEVSVVGVDDDQILCELSNPSLSSVVLSAEQGGYRAAELLDQQMKNPKLGAQCLEVEPLWVVSRQSTDVVAVEDQEVAAALRYIRQNARQPIGVKDVVSQVALSRRALEIRFERSLGRSIRTEIQRVRLVWVKQLLVETEMSVEKISNLVGFSSLSYLSKVFRRETDETLAQYRVRNRPS
jgi:LacI family transcriptional regulator